VYPVKEMEPEEGIRQHQDSIRIVLGMRMRHVEE
jgi:hypothetical protein